MATTVVRSRRPAPARTTALLLIGLFQCTLCAVLGLVATASGLRYTPAPGEADIGGSLIFFGLIFAGIGILLAFGLWRFSANPFAKVGTAAMEVLFGFFSVLALPVIGFWFAVTALLALIVLLSVAAASG